MQEKEIIGGQALRVGTSGKRPGETLVRFGGDATMVASRLGAPSGTHREINMVEIIRADLHNPRHGEALIAMLDEYARDEMGAAMHWRTR